MRRHFQMARGVTLLELLVVVVIIGILIFGANIAYQDYYARVATRGFAAAVLNKAREARKTAVALNRNVIMNINMGNQTIYNTYLNDAGETVQVGTSLSCGYKRVGIVNACYFNSGVVGIKFYSRGTSSVLFNGATQNMIGNTQVHIGDLDAMSLYDTGVNANSIQYNTVAIFVDNGAAASFSRGCFANDPYRGSWPVCSAI